ncbi:Brp/Blh family beta-carotene 15,15'-dioxygenase [Frondihabitans peucedani]|uniref:Brp/Blh family beta-carotene 15,15'-dioxygenase n=1 Tax=Frondihabitans peucedani TaxID=598626 RepID=UPI0031CEA129
MTVTLVLVTVTAAALALAGRPIPMAIQLIPFAISIVVFGLPHGALDHLVPARLRPGTRTWQSIAVIVITYLVVGGATAAIWALNPLCGFALFLLLTWFHWGQGDLYIDHFFGNAAPTRIGSGITVALRGALPMLVPLACHPASYANVINQTARSTGTDHALVLGALTSPGIRICAGIVVLVLALASTFILHRSHQPLRRHISEMIVLIAFFAVVPPVLAVGLYFTLWHSVRHILRLELTDQDSHRDLQKGLLLRPLARFLRQAWPITVIAIGLLVGLAATLRTMNLGTYLVLIAVLTSPHAAVVTWMDRQQYVTTRIRRERKEIGSTCAEKADPAAPSGCLQSTL